VQVLEITQRYAPAIGGVEDHVAQLTRELRKHGVEVKISTSDLLRDRPFQRLADGGADPDPRVRRHRAVPLLPLPHGVGIVAPGMFREAVRSSADLVHAHAFGYAPTWAGALRRALGRGPVVITPHSDEGRGGWGSTVYARTVARGTLLRADRVIALTEHERTRLLGLGVPGDRLRVIPNGIDLGEFSGSEPRPSSGGTFRILFVGRLYNAQKGIDTLLGAVDALGPPAELRIVGEDWGAGEMIARWARDRAAGIGLKVLGKVARSAVLQEYRSADVLVLPSRFEPFGIVLLEAMASGIPVVASRVGGIPEIVEDGRTGLLVPPGEPDRLADALRTLRDDPGFARRMGDAGRRRAETFSWDRLGPRFVELFRELTER
jgi:glycogen synthase